MRWLMVRLVLSSVFKKFMGAPVKKQYASPSGLNQKFLIQSRAPGPKRNKDVLAHSNSFECAGMYLLTYWFRYSTVFSNN